jgi:hypothetical protein
VFRRSLHTNFSLWTQLFPVIQNQNGVVPSPIYSGGNIIGKWQATLLRFTALTDQTSELLGSPSTTHNLDSIFINTILHNVCHHQYDDWTLVAWEATPFLP